MDKNSLVLENVLIKDLVELQESLGRAQNTLNVMYSAYERMSKYMKLDKESLINLTKKDAQAIVKKMHNDGYAHSTIKLSLVYIKELYNNEEIEHPFTKLKYYTEKRHEDKDSFDTFELHEVKEIMKNVRSKENFHQERDIALINLLFSAGLRKSECIRLNIEDVDFENNKIILWNTKREAKKTIIVSQSVIEAINNYLDTRDDDIEALFISSYNRRFSTSGFDKAVKNIYKLSGFDNTIHATRHACASMLSDMGKGLVEIQQHMRHASSQTTLRYIKISEAKKIDVAESLSF